MIWYELGSNGVAPSSAFDLYAVAPRLLGRHLCPLRRGQVAQAEFSLIFAGEFEHRIDPQGRISIPARFRPAFEDGIILSKAYDRCVTVYTQGEWQKVADHLADLPATAGASRRLNRLQFSGAYPSQLDRSGRVLMPPQLREYAGLGENVVLVGTGRFFEIWDRSAWEQERELLDAEASEIAEAAGTGTPPSAAGGDRR